MLPPVDCQSGKNAANLPATTFILFLYSAFFFLNQCIYWTLSVLPGKKLVGPVVFRAHGDDKGTEMSRIKNLIMKLSISPVDHPPVCCDRLVGLFLRGDIWVQSAVGSLIVSQKRHDVRIKRCKNTFLFFCTHRHSAASCTFWLRRLSVHS